MAQHADDAADRLQSDGQGGDERLKTVHGGLQGKRKRLLLIWRPRGIAVNGSVLVVPFGLSLRGQSFSEAPACNFVFHL
jgi:hypothetical protein